jgi:pimeloyl-ACP methyl ester carboxylesterase
MYRADDLGSIQVPTLIATGELDPGSTPEMPATRRAHSRRGSVVLAEQRHMMPVEARAWSTKMLLDFLAQARTLTESAKGIVA